MRVTMIKGDARAREKPCLRCGYSLRKIDSTHCPECGLSVWLSLNQNDTLEMSNPAWLRGMVRGLWVMAAAQIPAIVAFAIIAMYWVPAKLHDERVERAFRGVAATGTDDPAAYQAAFAKLPPAPPPLDAGTLRVVILLAAAYLVAHHVGLFLLVQPERRYPDRLQTPRVVAWVVCALAGLVALAMVAWSLSPTASTALGFGFRAVVVAGGLVTFTYLRRLAKRYPHPPLAKACAWLMLLPALSLLKVFPFCALVMVRHVAWLLDFLPAVFLPVCLVLFVWFARLLRRAAGQADGYWASETALTR